MPIRNPSDDPGVWTYPTLLNGWTPYGSSYPTAAYRRNSEGVVFLRGVVTHSSPVASQAICQLTAGNRPGGPQMFVCLTANASTLGIEIGRVDVATNGQVIYYGGGGAFLNLSNIIFLAGG